DLLIQAVALASQIPAEDFFEKCKTPDFPLPDVLFKNHKDNILKNFLSALSFSLPIHHNKILPEEAATERKRLKAIKDSRVYNSRTRPLFGKYKFADEIVSDSAERKARALKALLAATAESQIEQSGKAANYLPTELKISKSSTSDDSELGSAKFCSNDEMPKAKPQELNEVPENSFLSRINHVIAEPENANKANIEWLEYNKEKDCFPQKAKFPADSKRAADPDSITDEDGWTTKIIKQVIEESSKAKSSLFNLSQEDLDAIFDRMIIGKERQKSQKTKKATDIPKTSLLGKICEAKLDTNISYSGKISDVGKFLLDPDAVYAFEQILLSKRVNEQVKRLSPEQSKVIDKLHSRVSEQKATVGTIVMGKDGLPISAKLPQGLDVDEIAAWTFCAQLNCKIATQILSADNMSDLIMSSQNKDMLVSDFGEFFLITLFDDHNPQRSDELLKKFDRMRNPD
ncbi:MAG: roadblock/LC7 domain-containing protein, partial [Candidatus Obscuribacterales bacterium]|nr:roadblock/LC7 domain-containing protein [Candidatus Obscuribacterales bacterium]